LIESGEAREREVLLGQRVERVHLVADGADERRGFLHLGPGPVAHDVPEHLGVQLDGGDRVAHLVGHLQRQAADGGHPLRHQELLLCRLEPRQGAHQLGVEPLDLGPRPALALGDVAEGEGGEAHQPRDDDHGRPADPRRRERGGGGVEQARQQGHHEPGARPEVVGVDGDEREEQQVEDAVAPAGEVEEDEDEEHVHGERADEDAPRGARIHGHEREHPGLVGGEPDDEGVDVDAAPGAEREQAERGEAAHHDDREQDREDALVPRQEPDDGRPRSARFGADKGLGAGHPGRIVPVKRG
jgi:hypothetical protein